ncbi:hypothetical protein BRARA_G01956 [Brassica rapa]|uniref:CFA20 domain-containing protein n=1 Tax=Brassica campestris TaxID=3711 RepID=A0A397YMN4_BRACM|nr:hypothetical protein BRARA_G01956 [Brassica rapa]
MPLKMDEGWKQIQLNLPDLTRRARIYFAERLYSDEELPPEFKLYLPVQTLFNCRKHECVSADVLETTLDRHKAS